jgi:hypothetical protein
MKFDETSLQILHSLSHKLYFLPKQIYFRVNMKLRLIDFTWRFALKNFRAESGVIDAREKNLSSSVLRRVREKIYVPPSPQQEVVNVRQKSSLSLADHQTRSTYVITSLRLFVIARYLDTKREKSLITAR